MGRCKSTSPAKAGLFLCATSQFFNRETDCYRHRTVIRGNYTAFHNSNLELERNVNKRLVSGIALIQAGVLGAALAPAPVMADGGFYIGGSAGGATLEADIGDIGIPGLPSSIDEDETATKIFAGYTFDLPAIDLGIEAGYVDFGEPEISVLGSDLIIDTTGINVWGIASLDAGPIDIFGKLGYIAWDVEAEYLGASDGDDGSDIGYGAGLRFNLGSIEVRGEYEIYDLEGTDLSMLSVGVAWHFN